MFVVLSVPIQHHLILQENVLAVWTVNVPVADRNLHSTSQPDRASAGIPAIVSVVGPPPVAHQTRTTVARVIVHVILVFLKKDVSTSVHADQQPQLSHW